MNFNNPSHVATCFLVAQGTCLYFDVVLGMTMQLRILLGPQVIHTVVAFYKTVFVVLKARCHTTASSILSSIL